MIGVIAAYFGPLAEGERVLAPLLELAGPPAMAHVGPLPYTALQMLLNDAFPEGAHVYFKAEFMDDWTDDAIDTVVEKTAAPTSPLAQVLFQPMGGAVDRAAPDDTALPVRDAKWCYHALTVWLPDVMGPDEVHVNWTKDLAAAMKPYARPGIYLNFVADEGLERVQSSYGEHWDRLVALKDRYDPGNLFRLNQNIPPSAG
jgi:FAD/FMN-containing dehydrogenase